jgi:hypothetical protein
MNLNERIDRAVRAAGIAIDGVSIGDPENRATWRVSPSALQAAAQPIIDAFVIPDAQILADEEADLESNRKIIRALARECYDAIPANPNKPATFTDFMQRIKARYRALTS